MEGGAENAEPQHETYALHKKFWLVGGGGGQIGGGPTIAAKAQFAPENPILNLKTLNQIPRFWVDNALLPKPVLLKDPHPAFSRPLMPEPCISRND